MYRGICPGRSRILPRRTDPLLLAPITRIDGMERLRCGRLSVPWGYGPATGKFVVQPANWFHAAAAADPGPPGGGSRPGASARLGRHPQQLGDPDAPDGAQPR